MKSALRFTVIALASLLILAACGVPSATPAPTAAPEATQAPSATAEPAPAATATPTDLPPLGAGEGGGVGDGCIVGTWVVTDFNTYMASALSVAMRQAGQLTFKDTTGTLEYTFGDDGVLSGRADQFTINADMTVGDTSMPLAISMDGSGTAAYAVATGNDQVAFSDFTNDAFTLNVTMAGMPLGDAVDTGGLVWFGQSGNTFSMAMQCSGDTLRLTPQAGISGLEPVVFNRTG